MLTKNREIKIVLEMENELNALRMQRYILLMSNIGRLTMIGWKGDGN
ncbi:MAG: hypothetical protein QW279_09535 [Candidatus Jordarchaeaceae archaeon]